MSLMTEEQFKEALPPAIRRTITPEVMDDINNMLMDPEVKTHFRENLISYTNVMLEGRFKISNYINAVKYVSFKLLGSSNKDAYIKTFPDKYVQFLADGVSAKDIASYTSAYHKSKLVNLIMAQTLVPFHVLNAPARQQALNTQVELMLGAKSEKVRSDAANSVLTHLKPPEEAVIELDVKEEQGDVIKTLTDTIVQLATDQQESIINGAKTVKSIAESPLQIADSGDDD